MKTVRFSFTLIVLCSLTVCSYFLARSSGGILFTSLLASKRRSNELSRPINVANIPKRTPALCRIQAKQDELEALSNRLDLAGLTYFAANVTMQWQDLHTVQVHGDVEGHLVSRVLSEKHVLKTEFNTKLLSNVGATIPRSMDDHEEYDEEVDADGNIDIGEIVTQYFAMELY